MILIIKSVMAAIAGTQMTKKDTPSSLALRLEDISCYEVDISYRMMNLVNSLRESKMIWSLTRTKWYTQSILEEGSRNGIPKASWWKCLSEGKHVPTEEVYQVSREQEVKGPAWLIYCIHFLFMWRKTICLMKTLFHHNNFR